MTRRRARDPLISSVVLRPQSDAVLTGLAADGHQLAFKTIFERYERELRAHASRMVRPSRVDDVLQHAMLNAWTALLTGRTVEQLRPWLHRIVHTTALNTLSRRGYDDGALPAAVVAPTVTAELAEGRITAIQALAAIAALPAAQREALVLTALEGQSAKAAAAEMGLSEGAVRQLAFRARAGVRTAVSAVTPLPLLLMGAARENAAAVAGGAATGSLGGGAMALKAAAVLAITVGTAGTVENRHRVGGRPEHQATAQHAADHARLAALGEQVSQAVRPAAVTLHTPARVSRRSARPLLGAAGGPSGAANRPAHAKGMVMATAGSSGAAGPQDALESNGSRDDEVVTRASKRLPDSARSGDSIASAADSESSTDASPDRGASAEEPAPVLEPRSETSTDEGGGAPLAPPAAEAQSAEPGT